MMNAKTTTIPSTLLTRIVRGRAALDVLLVVFASAIIALAAQIAIPIPFSPVPLTLQPRLVAPGEQFVSLPVPDDCWASARPGAATSIAAAA